MTLATRRLGRTGHQSSLCILGGAAFGTTTPDETAAAFELALAAGVNHVDIAPTYGDAELVAGPLIAANRDRLFVSEKTARKNADGVRAQLETSLERLGCDTFDLYQAHGVTSLADLDTRTHAFEAILRARDEGLVRYVGVTGHNLTTPAAQLEAVRRYDLDTVMLPVYAGALAIDQYADDLALLLDECARRDVGVMAIKVGAFQPWGDQAKTAGTWYQPLADAERIANGVRFTLSTPGVVACCTPGETSLLPMVFEAAERYEPMTAGERADWLADAAGWPTIFPLETNAR